MTEKRRIIVGISGASGVIYGIRMLETLRRLEIETHLVMSRSGEGKRRQSNIWRFQ